MTEREGSRESRKPVKAATSTPAGTGVEQQRRRRGLVYGVVVLAALFAILSSFAIWANRQLLETDEWVETSTELLEDEEIRDALGAYLVDELFASVDVQARLERLLPPDVKPVAGPISGAVRSLAEDRAPELLANPRAIALWERANRATHAQLLAAVEERDDAVVSNQQGVVTLDLREVLSQLTAQLGIGGDLVQKLPSDVAELEVLDSEELEAAQDGVRVLRGLAWFLAVITLLLFALAVYLARGWRREALRAIGLAVVVVGDRKSVV